MKQGLSHGTLLLVLALFLAMPSVHSLIHHLTIRNDHRSIFKIESFGFLKGGTMELDVSNFHVKAPNTTPSKGNTNNNKPSEREKNKMVEEMDAANRRTSEEKTMKSGPSPSYNVGFILRHAASESAAEADLERIVDRKECIFDKRHENDLYIDISDESDWPKLSFVHEIDEEREIGFYTLIFAHCNTKISASSAQGEKTSTSKYVSPSSHYAKSFKLTVKFKNPGPNYLSAGDAPLPVLYFVFFLLFLTALAAWLFVIQGGRRHALQRAGSVQKIHYLMLALLAVKVLTLLFESIRFHYISIFGVSEVWSVVYYFFTTLKGVMLFTVILLIGSGYSLVKSYLSENEKKIVYVVLVLQVLDNVAMVVLEETAPGSQSWLTWKDILHLVDVLCCVAILLPIIWSIRHLRQAAEVDGKAHNNLVKLQLFRKFYIIVVVFIYFTRIAVFLIESTMPFYLQWLGAFLSELATLVFYVHTGYQFRPLVSNPYFAVSSEDAEGSEYGLAEEDPFDARMEIEVAAPAQPRKYVK